MRDELIEAVERSVRGGIVPATWPRYLEYRVQEYADGGAWAVAEPPAHWQDGRWSSLPERQKDRALLGSDPLAAGQGRLYSPFTDAPDLFIEFARLEPTREEWRSFLRRYGTLGPDRRRDEFSRFVVEVRRAGRVLALYEAATAEPVPDAEAIARVFAEDGVLRDPNRWAKKVASVYAGRTALREVDLVAEDVVRTETFAQPYCGGREERPLPSWGFRSLLGAIWLQFFSLRTYKREPPRCRAYDCNNPLEAGGEGKKALYKTKTYCSKACGERDRGHNRRLSRNLSRTKADTT